MKVVNILTFLAGVLTSVESFGSLDDDSQRESEKISKAKFIEKAKELGYDGSNDEKLIADGYYQTEATGSHGEKRNEIRLMKSASTSLIGKGGSYCKQHSPAIY